MKNYVRMESIIKLSKPRGAKVVWFMLTRGEPYGSRDGRLYGAKLKKLSR